MSFFFGPQQDSERACVGNAQVPRVAAGQTVIEQSQDIGVLDCQRENFSLSTAEIYSQRQDPAVRGRHGLNPVQGSHNRK